jgi:outer membrane immunogenic protein
MQIKLSRRGIRSTGAVALCGIFVALIGATNASAGAPEMKEVAPVPPQAIDWNGIYMGFNAGVVWDNYSLGQYGTDVNLGQQFESLPQNMAPVADPPIQDQIFLFSTFFAPGHSDTDVAPIGGLHVGYNKQFGHFVAGLEFGFEGTQTSKGSQSRSFQTNFFGAGGGTDGLNNFLEADTRFDTSRRAERNWDGWVGGQLGYAWGRFLFYATGGYTFTDVTVYTSDRAQTDFYYEREIFLGHVSSREYTNAGDIMNGWFAGGGAQYALNNKVAIGIQYRHSDFGDETFRFNPMHPIFPGATNVDLSSNQVEFTVNIMLGHLGH